MKRVLVIYYTQSGQLKEIAENTVSSFVNSEDFEVDFYRIKPKNDFGFPWDSSDFYNAFPESFRQIPTDIYPPPKTVLDTEYDLIILAYQIWFLTPSIPVNSFLKSNYSSQLLKGKKVVSLIGCRNMWAKAQQKTKYLIEDNGGRLVGNIAFVDRHLNHISVVTIAHWMMGGKKTKKWGIFPKPGVSDKDIENASAFGKLIFSAQQQDDFSKLQKEIINRGGASLKPFIIFMDETANKMFDKWSKFILKSKKHRKFKVTLFKIYLLIAIWLISPIVYVGFILSFPFRLKQIRQKNILYCNL